MKTKYIDTLVKLLLFTYLFSYAEPIKDLPQIGSVLLSWIQESPPYIVQISPTEYYHTSVSSEFKGNPHGWKLNGNAIRPLLLEQLNRWMKFKRVVI